MTERTKEMQRMKQAEELKNGEICSHDEAWAIYSLPIGIDKILLRHPEGIEIVPNICHNAVKKGVRV